MCYCCGDVWGGFLKVFLESFSKGPRGFPYVFIIEGKVITLKPVYGPTFVDHGVFVLGGDQKVFDGAITFEVALYTIPPTEDLFNAFTETLGVWCYYMTLVLTSLVTDWVPAVPWLLVPSLTSLDDLVSLFSTLSIAQ